MNEQQNNFEPGQETGVSAVFHTDTSLARADALLAQLGQAERAIATRERVDRIVAATTPALAAPVDTGPLAHIGDVRERTQRATARRFSAMKIAAGLTLTLSVGAAVMALRNSSPTSMVASAPKPTAMTVLAEADLDTVDAYFASEGSTVSDTWTDAEALHTRVSADWASDDLFGNSDSQNGESL